MKTAAEDGDTPRGRSVDAYGSPSVDPSENVKALSEAASRRQDDLRDASERLTELRVSALEQLLKLRAECIKEVSDVDIRRINEQLSLRAQYDERLASAEAKRLDAARAVDIAAVSTAAQRASDQASVLQSQVLTSADTLRQLVATTAAATSAALQQVVTTLAERIASLERAQYQSQGRSALADPAFTELLSEVKGLRDSRSMVTGTGQGIDKTWGIVAVVVTIALAATGAFVTLNRGATPAPVMTTAPAVSGK